MNPFVFSNPTKLIFGKGQLSRLAKEVSRYGRRVLFVYGGGSIKKNGIYEQVMEELKKMDAVIFEFGGVEPNPRLTTVHKGVQICKENDIEFILAVGGGSVIDAAKAIAAGAKYDGDVWDIIIRKARPKEAIPFGIVLTHAATGSEVNGSSVITHWELKQKVGWGSLLTFPKFSILDPSFTATVPKEQTVYGIIDMMCHVLETYFDRAENVPLQERFCESLLVTMIETAPKLINDLTNYEYRETIMFCGSMALYGTTRMGMYGDWATHEIEHVLSALYDIPHAGGLAILYPQWLKFTADIDPTKHVMLAKNVFGIDTAGKTEKEVAYEMIDKLKQFWQELGAPAKLSHYGIDDAKFDVIAEMACANGELGTYVKLKKKDVLTILQMAK